MRQSAVQCTQRVAHLGDTSSAVHGRNQCVTMHTDRHILNEFEASIWRADEQAVSSSQMSLV